MTHERLGNAGICAIGTAPWEEEFVGHVKEEIDLLVGEYRLGMLRGTTLSQTSQLYLQHFEKALFGKLPTKISKVSRTTPVVGFAIEQSFFRQRPSHAVR